jgi:chromosome segregation ATPase
MFVLLQFLTAVCQNWIVRYYKRQANQLRCEKEANKYYPLVLDLQKKIGQRSATLTAYQQKTDHELVQLNLQLKNLNEKLKSNEMRLTNYKNQLEWITMAVRSHLRRKSIVESTSATLFIYFSRWNLFFTS